MTIAMIIKKKGIHFGMGIMVVIAGVFVFSGVALASGGTNYSVSPIAITCSDGTTNCGTYTSFQITFACQPQGGTDCSDFDGLYSVNFGGQLTSIPVSDSNWDVLVSPATLGVGASNGNGITISMSGVTLGCYPGYEPPTCSTTSTVATAGTYATLNYEMAEMLIMG